MMALMAPRAGSVNLLEFSGDLVEGDPVGDPEVGVDFAFANQLDDVVKIFGQGVAGSHQGDFATMENRGVGEC